NRIEGGCCRQDRCRAGEVHRIPPGFGTAGRHHRRVRREEPGLRERIHMHLSRVLGPYLRQPVTREGAWVQAPVGGTLFDGRHHGIALPPRTEPQPTARPDGLASSLTRLVTVPVRASRPTTERPPVTATQT